MSIVPESVEYHLGNIPATLAMSWFVWAVIIVVSFIVLKTYKAVPGKPQSAFEYLFDYVAELAYGTIGPEYHRYYPLFLGIFIYILISNLIGLIPGFISPTSDPYDTAALAIVVFIYYNYQGIRKHGFGYLKHFAGPELPWFLFPVKILMIFLEIFGLFVRPFSLALRLFCNIFSKELLLGILALLFINFLSGGGTMEKALAIAPLLLRPFIILLGLLIGFIQALIFTVLSISYVSGAIALEEH